MEKIVNHAQIMQEVLDHCKMNATEFAREMGLDNAQTIYNILHDKHGISTRLAKQISDRFPEITFDFLKGRTKNIQRGDQSINIQASESEFSARDISLTKDNEIKTLKEENARLKELIQEYREREKMFMKLLDKT